MSQDIKDERIDKTFNLKINEPELQDYIDQLRFKLYVAESNNEYFLDEVRRLEEENQNLREQIYAPKIRTLNIKTRTQVKEI